MAAYCIGRKSACVFVSFLLSLTLGSFFIIFLSPTILRLSDAFFSSSLSCMVQASYDTRVIIFHNAVLRFNLVGCLYYAMILESVWSDEEDGAMECSCRMNIIFKFGSFLQRQNTWFFYYSSNTVLRMVVENDFILLMIYYTPYINLMLLDSFAYIILYMCCIIDTLCMENIMVYIK